MKKTLYHQGHRWTDDELKLLMEMWLQDAPLATIATELNSTNYAISKMIVRLRQNGIPLPRRNRGHKVGSNSGKLWTQGEAEYVARRRQEKATVENIAAELGRTYSAVNAMIQRLRKEGVTLAMQGCGVRRLWNPELLQATLRHTAPEAIDTIKLDDERERRRLSSV